MLALHDDLRFCIELLKVLYLLQKPIFYIDFTIHAFAKCFIKATCYLLLYDINVEIGLNCWQQTRRKCRYGKMLGASRNWVVRRLILIVQLAVVGGINREIYRESRAKSTVRKFRASITRVYNSWEICLQKEWNNRVNRLRIIPKEVLFADFTHGLFPLSSYVLSLPLILSHKWIMEKSGDYSSLSFYKIIPPNIRLKKLIIGEFIENWRSKRCAVCILFFTYLKNKNSVDQVYW